MSVGRVVITDVDYPDLAIERGILEQAGIEMDVHHVKDGPELIEITRPADGLIVQYARITRPVIDAMEHCRVVARYGVGLDTIDVEAARARGIVVHNVPDYCTEEVADHALALMLSLLRGVHRLANEVAEARWSLHEVRPLRRIRGMTLGLVGCGRIGAAVAARGNAFGFRVLGYDALLADEEVARRGIEPATLEQVLHDSDVLSLHRPATLDGTPALGAEELRRVKTGVIVINTARGTLIDEKALREALDNGRVRAAGLDVLQKEPPESYELARLPNVVITPHAAWYSEESEVQMRSTVARLVRDALLARNG